MGLALAAGFGVAMGIARSNNARNRIGDPQFNVNDPSLGRAPSTDLPLDLQNDRAKLGSFLFDQLRTSGKDSALLAPSLDAIGADLSRQREASLQEFRDNPRLSEGDILEAETRLRRAEGEATSRARIELTLGLEARRTAGLFEFLQLEAQDDAQRLQLQLEDLFSRRQTDLGRRELEIRNTLGREQISNDAFNSGVGSFASFVG